MLSSYKFAPIVAFALTLVADMGQLEAQYTGPVAVKQHTEAVAIAPPPVKNHFLGNIVGGASLNSGNTNSYTVTLGGHLEWVHHKNQLMFDALGLMNAAKPAESEPGDHDEYKKIAANVVGRARYDRFLSDNDALFLAAVPRRDIFAGLNLRLQMQAGYSRNLFVPSNKQRLWAEAGYDLTYDDFSTIKTVKDDTITVSESQRGPAGLPLGTEIISRTTTTDDPGHEFVNSARAFFGYTNSMTTLAVVSLGAEILFDVTDGKNIRINTLADFTTSLSTRFKIGFVSRMFFDQDPVEGKDEVDFVSTLQVIYTYDSFEGAAKEEAASCDCDCEAEVQKASEACTQPLQSSAPLNSNPPVQEPAVSTEPGVMPPVQTPTTTTTPSAPVPAPTTPPAATAPVTAPATAPTAPPVPVTPVTPPTAPKP